ncbi:MAG: hypothetical protein IJS40_01255 [Synergistaceae bacterium]|nr:hypothetical protein [Synergistaceae bacterium]
MPTCFLITPIGEAGSETRQYYDDLRDLIVKPVLEPMGFTVLRGDHRSEAGQIDIDVIRAVQESDLCIADLSMPNPNVFYEFGRRDETGKPLILLKSRGSDSLPVDVATRRYIEYDLDTRRGIIDAHEQLKNFVKPLMERGFESSGTGASLAELAEVTRRIERKIDRLMHGTKGQTQTLSSDGGNTSGIPKGVDPKDYFIYALRQQNIPAAEAAMNALKVRVNHHRWLDFYVEQAASIGSVSAGDILIENAREFIDESETFKEKTEYLGCLTTNLLRTDRESANLELVEQICRGLKATSENEDPELQIEPYNQLNRLYYGIYITTKDREWLEKALKELRGALQIKEDAAHIHYNIATCLKRRNEEGDMEIALEHVLRCIELDGDDLDDDHIETACEILHELQDERLSEFLDMLEGVNQIKATLLRGRLQ